MIPLVFNDGEGSLFPTNESADSTSTVLDVVMNALVDSGDNRMVCSATG